MHQNSSFTPLCVLVLKQFHLQILWVLNIFYTWVFLILIGTKFRFYIYISLQISATIAIIIPNLRAKGENWASLKSVVKKTVKAVIRLGLETATWQIILERQWNLHLGLELATIKATTERFRFWNISSKCDYNACWRIKVEVGCWHLLKLNSFIQRDCAWFMLVRVEEYIVCSSLLPF